MPPLQPVMPLMGGPSSVVLALPSLSIITTTTTSFPWLVGRGQQELLVDKEVTADC